MQVFLPYPNFAHSVASLDRARLGKQRIECRQILVALRALRNGRQVGWSNHPATKAWIGYDSALAVYFTMTVNEWIARGYTNTIVTPYDEEWKLRAGEDNHLLPNGCDVPMPEWLGQEDFHCSHRSNLLRKDPEYYRQHGWDDPDDLDYIWPKPVFEGEPT